MIIKNLRRLLGNSIFRLQDRFGRFQIKSSAGSVAVLMYHGLESSVAKLNSRPLDIEPAHCLAEILFLRKQGYQVIAPHQLDALPASGNYLIVTFDDGHRNIHPHLCHWMEKYQLPFTLAVCPDIIESQTPFWWEESRARFELSSRKSFQLLVSNNTVELDQASHFLTLATSVSNSDRLAMLQQLRIQSHDVSDEQIKQHDAVHANMTWAQLRDLAANPLCTLASHSLAHEIATHLDRQELIDNAVECRQAIEKNTGRNVCDFVYPNGIYNAATDQCLKEAGYKRWFCLDETLNSPFLRSGRLARFRGYGFGSDNLRYYAHLWNQRHTPRKDQPALDTATPY